MAYELTEQILFFSSIGLFPVPIITERGVGIYPTYGEACDTIRSLKPDGTFVLWYNINQIDERGRVLPQGRIPRMTYQQIGVV